MSKATHGQPQGISHHVASFRVREFATDLKKDPVYGSSGKNARTLVKDSDLPLVLTTVRKDAVIHEHKAPANAALLLIDGEILFTGSGTGETTIVEPSQTLVFSRRLSPFTGSQAGQHLSPRTRSATSGSQHPSLPTPAVVKEVTARSHFRLNEKEKTMRHLMPIARSAFLTLMIFTTASLSSGFTFVPKAQLKIEKAEWTHAPNMPPPIARNEPRLVTVDWTATETQKEIVDGQIYQQYWTFEGSVPGPVLRVRQGDVVRVTLTNAVSSKMEHNIDFHFVTGQGGGATALSVQPGKTAAIEVRAMHPGFFMYHCATHDIPEHIGNGMYGYVLVEPAGGLPKADKEYYVVQSEFYADEAEDGNLVYSSAKADAETPTFMFFNGSLDALMEDKALKAEVGDVVRLYVGNAGPNKVSSFHVIGEIFDRVWREGDLTSPPARSVQTTLIPAGGATVVGFQVEQPATYILVDHAINRMHIGLVGSLVVSGNPNPEIFEVVKTP